MSATAPAATAPHIAPAIRRARPLGSRVGSPATLAAAAAFVAIALPAGMMGVVWPEARLELGRSLGSLSVVTSVYGLARLATAATGNPVARRFGFGHAFVAGLVAMAVSGVAFAAAPTWPMFLVAVVALALASGVLDSLVALYLSVRSDVADAGLVHGMFGVGATAGPLLVAALPGWRSGLAVAVVATLAAVAIAVRVHSSWPAPPVEPLRTVERRAPLPRWPVAISLGVFAAAVAVEVTFGQWSYAWLTEARGVSTAAAATAVAAFWGGMTALRLVMSRRTVARLIGRWGLAPSAAAAAVVLTMMSVLPVLPDPLAVVALAMIGVALAPVIPTLFATTAARVGAAAATRVAGWQLLAFNVGAVGVMSLTGVLVDAVGPGVVVPVVTTILVTTALPLLHAADRLHRGR